MSWRIIEGDCRDLLRELGPGSVQTCVTSPPYFGLRDYGHAGQLGLEATPDEYAANLVAVFRQIRRVLRDDGTVWLNLGDSYNTAGGVDNRGKYDVLGSAPRSKALGAAPGCKSKDLLGIPWMVAFALRADGWYLRSDIIWSKPNPMPESVTDRPTKAHEYLFLLSKGPRYFYDADAIREEFTADIHGAELPRAPVLTVSDRNDGGARIGRPNATGRNRRSVWTVATQPFPGAHFATFPSKLIEPCIFAGSQKGNVVLDPFAGAGTTGVVAAQHGRQFIGIELSPEYARMARLRIALEGRPGGIAHHEPDRPIDGQLTFEGAA